MAEILWHRRETRRQTEKTNVSLKPREAPVYSTDLHRGKKRQLFTQGHFYLVFYSKYAENILVFSATNGTLPGHDIQVIDEPLMLER